MNFSLLHRTDALLICSILFVGMVIMISLGILVSKHAKDQDVSIRDGIGSLRTAVFGLFAFILAFCFGMSGSRYDAVRNIVADESNVIKTAIMRADLYTDSLRSEYRKDFKQYLHGRTELYANVYDVDRMKHGQAEMDTASKNLWARTALESKMPNMLIPTGNMITALTSMFDTGNKRSVLMQTSVPDGIVFTVLLMALVSSFTAGITSNRFRFREWIIILCFSLFASLVIYVTLDLGRPLRGLIKVDRSEAAIAELQILLEQ